MQLVVWGNHIDVIDPGCAGLTIRIVFEMRHYATLLINVPSDIKYVIDTLRNQLTRALGPRLREEISCALSVSVR